MPSSPRFNAPDWRLLRALLPYLCSAYAWLCWLAFLLLASVWGVHDTLYFSALENTLYCLLGLVLCLATTVAAQDNQAMLSLLLTLSVQLLAAWF